MLELDTKRNKIEDKIDGRKKNGYFKKGNTYGVGGHIGRPKGLKNQLTILRENLLEALNTTCGISGRSQLAVDIESLKPNERCKLAASILPKAIEIGIQVGADFVPILLDKIDDTIDVVSNEKPIIAQNKGHNGRIDLHLERYEGR